MGEDVKWFEQNNKGRLDIQASFSFEDAGKDDEMDIEQVYKFMNGEELGVQDLGLRIGGLRGYQVRLRGHQIALGQDHVVGSGGPQRQLLLLDRKSTRLNSSH